MVLLKDIEDDAFVFYTNFDSAKGRELAASGKAAFVAHWKSLRRQLRVRGHVTRVDDATGRRLLPLPRLQSRLGAWASRQSQPLSSREALMAEVAKITVDEGAEPRPPAALGRLPHPTRGNRVLGRRRLPTPRPFPLDEGRGAGGVDDRPAQPVSERCNCTTWFNFAEINLATGHESDVN